MTGRGTALRWLLIGGLLAGCGAQPLETPEQPAEAGVLVFEDVTAAAGLSDFRHETGAFGQKWMPESLGGGGGFADLDGDGWTDIILVTGAHWPGHGPALPALTVYRNRGDGTFEPWTAQAGLDRYTAYGMGIAAADYDNGGDTDLFLTALGPNLLFQNDGRGRFREVSREAGLRGDTSWSTAAIFFDADRDGWICSTAIMWTGRLKPICSALPTAFTKTTAHPVSTMAYPDAFFTTTVTAPSAI